MDPLIHDIHGIHDDGHDNFIYLRVATLDTSAIMEITIVEASQQIQQEKKVFRDSARIQQRPAGHNSIKHN